MSLCTQCTIFRHSRAHLQYCEEIEFASMNRPKQQYRICWEKKMGWWSGVAATGFICENESSVKSWWGRRLAGIVTWFFFCWVVFVACLPIPLRLLENMHRSYSVGGNVHVYTVQYTEKIPMFEESEESAVCNTKRIFPFNKHKHGLGEKSMQSPLCVYVIEISSTCEKLPVFRKFNFIYDFSTTTKLNAHELLLLVRIAIHARAHTHTLNTRLPVTVKFFSAQFNIHTASHTHKWIVLLFCIGIFIQ